MRKRILRSNFVISVVLLLVFIVGLVLAIVTINTVGVFIGLLALISIFVLLRIFRRRMITRYIEADRLVVDVTGDPVALLVALHTLVFFNPRVKASVMLRINSLEKLMQGPGPRAPWASKPVSSVVPVVRGPYPFTVPLEQATAPEPVPLAPYESSMMDVSAFAPQRAACANYERFS